MYISNCYEVVFGQIPLSHSPPADSPTALMRLECATWICVAKAAPDETPDTVILPSAMLYVSVA